MPNGVTAQPVATDLRFQLPEDPQAAPAPEQPVVGPPTEPGLVRAPEIPGGIPDGVVPATGEAGFGGERLLSRFDALFGGGGGGGGGERGGGRRRGDGGGGGGQPLTVDIEETTAGDPELVNLLEEAVRNDVVDETLLEADPELRERLLQTIDTIEAERGQLIELDPETREQLATIREGEIAAFEEQLRQQQQDLLVQLFGRGQETSTIAGDVGQRLVVGSAAARAGIEAEAASREIDLRTALTAQSQQALQAQAQLLLGQQAQDFDDRQLLFQQQDARRTRNAQMLDAIYGRQTALEQTRVEAETQLRSTQISANSRVRAARVAANASVQSSRIAASASRFSSRLSAFVAGEQLAQRGFEFKEDLALRRFLGEADINLREQELRNQNRASRRQREGAFLGAIGSVIGGLAIAGVFSDARWKDNITYTGDIVGGLPWAKWNWSISGQEDEGVIAQDVLKIKPEIVIRGPLGLMVDYSKLGEYNA